MRFLETEQEEVQGVAAQWKAQYFDGREWGGILTGSGEEIYSKLLALPLTATAKDVADIIGNDSWVGENCIECGEHTAIVLVGEEPDYESRTVYLCINCVRRLAAMVEKA